MKTKHLFLGLAMLAWSLASIHAKPNVIVILVDDMGYSDAGAFGGEVKTPNMDRLSKRNEGLAADQLRLSLSLQSLMDSSADTYATDTNDVPLLNEGLNATAKHLSNSQTLLEDEARAWDQGVLEDLKRQRDALVSMRDMFDRRDRYDKDNIPYLERRIQNNETKLVTIRAKPEGLVKPGEIEKVTEAIIRVCLHTSVLKTC